MRTIEVDVFIVERQALVGGVGGVDRRLWWVLLDLVAASRTERLDLEPSTGIDLGIGQSICNRGTCASNNTLSDNV